MAAAIAAAIAATLVSAMSIRGMYPGTRVVTDAVGSTASPAAHERPTSRPGRVAADRAATRSHIAAASVLTSDDVERALADAPPHRDLVLSELLARLVGFDAQAAARVAERETSEYQREVALRVVAQSWARRDAIAAVNWATSLSEPQERDAALENAALELAASRPQLALRALERRSATRSPDATLAGVVQQWAAIDFAAAYAWAESQPPGSDRDALLTRLVFVRAGQDPNDAARIANTAFSADDRRIDALATIARVWGLQDPAAVRDLALGLDAKAQQRLLAELALLH
jgi:hypothetical protein